MDRELDPIKLEIFRLAQCIVNGEYADARAESHNRWVADSAALWQRCRQRLAYPEFPQYPTEEVIIARAEIMLNFLYLVKAEEAENTKPFGIEPLPDLTPPPPAGIIDTAGGTDDTTPRNSLYKMVDSIKKRL